MSTEFLDKTGLAYFWGKIKAYVASVLAGMVHIAGSETITGSKTFTSDLKLNGAALDVYASGTVGGTAVSQHDYAVQAKVANPISNGPHFLLGGSSSTIIRAGEGGETYFADFEGSEQESVVLIADGLMQFITAANTYENRKTITLSTYGSLSGLNDVKAVTFTGNLNGNADTATKATKDGSGNVITSTYAVDSGVVHKSGDESVGGVKKFSATVKTTSTFNVVNNNVDMRNVPSDTYNKYILFDDTNGYAIGVLQSRAAAANNSIRLKIRKYGDTSTTTAALVDVGLFSNTNSDYSFTPSTNGSMRLGGSNSKWSEVFASTGTINTSDVRLKTDIAYIPDEVLAVWETIPFYQFKFKSSVADKGEAARLHSGLLAQDIRDRFAEAGLDASRYGLFCHDSWDAQEAEYDSDGNLEYEAKPAGDEYALRYEEALCMEAACQRRRAERLEARVAALEARLSAAGL